jgi:tetratricopeptide (TPR) repeat protein
MLEYELSVEPDEKTRLIRLRLTDQDGVHCGSHQVVLAEHSIRLWEGLFDTRRYVERYTGSLLRDGASVPDTAEDLVNELGVFVGTAVLGPEIIQTLGQSKQRRSLVVRLPATEQAILASAFARVPWEIARPGVGEKSLMERNLVVRVVTESSPAHNQAAAAARGAVNDGKEPLRVLLVFAEAPGSRPLAMRAEREQLLELFEKEILPRRRVEVDVLCHGVTRMLLQERITASGGYHIVHWSGHGHHNRLEIFGEDGARDSLSGEDLVALIEDAGGFVPQIFFLSACLSGAFVGIRDWTTLQAALRADAAARDTGTSAGSAGGDVFRVVHVDEDRRPVEDILADPPGYTGTALALLRCGVPQVVAMRYSVGDSYARELAWWFYRRLLADDGNHGTDSALALARADVLQKGSDAAKAMPVDHANPLMFGQPGRLLKPARKRSDQMRRLRPQPQPLLAGRRELDKPRMFVGRGRELTQLRQQWRTAGGPAVALVQGLAGLGKTALAAESVHLWHQRFDWVLAFQAKPTALTIEDFLRQVDHKLTLASQAYRDKCDAGSNVRLFLEAGQPLRGEERYAQMRVNLLEALRDEAILLVLDNFETNLEIVAGNDGYACADPHWDRLLTALAQELPATRSHLLVTSRHRPAALADDATCLWLPLGPLQPADAALFIRSHVGLSALLFADDEARALLDRVLRVGRGHPFILERLGTLASDRVALADALARLERKGLKELPDLFVLSKTNAQTKVEQDYLEDVAVGSIDLLIERLAPEARRLLWLITLANEPVREELLEGVWAGHGGLPIAWLLAALHAAGLVSVEDEPTSMTMHNGQESAAGAAGAHALGPAWTYAFHEIVRERAQAWMDAHPTERAGSTVESVWVAYGKYYAAQSRTLLSSGMDGARDMAAEAGRRALVYLARGRAFEVLDGFAGLLVTSTHDPTLLRSMIVELAVATEAMPVDRRYARTRWRLRVDLAVALDNAGQPDQALALLEQALSEAEAAGSWDDVAVIASHWSNALSALDRLDAAKAARLRSAEAHRKHGSPRANLLGSELEALRIDVMQGVAKTALSEIEARLDEARALWQRHLAGESVPEAPDFEFLGRMLIGGLDTARQANAALERWDACLALLAELEQIHRARGEGEHMLARTRFNQYGPLLRLGRLDEAQRVVEFCVDVFRDSNDLIGQAKALSALADVWHERGSIDEAIALERQALSIRHRLPDPEGRALSHHNLAEYLGQAVRLIEALPHRLAAIIYRRVSGRSQDFKTSLQSLTQDIRRLHQANHASPAPAWPRLANLLTLPEFHALAEWLAKRSIDCGDLQADLEQLEADAREALTPFSDG